jgi:alpha-ribazole phosphatase
MNNRTRIHLIRHGEVAGAGTPRYNGHADVALSQRGVEQYHALKHRLTDCGISACYTSDLTRCRIGADILGCHLGVEPVVEPSLRELNIGIWEGMTWDEIQTGWPREWQERLADIVNYRVPEGENLLDLRSRIMPVIERIVAGHRGEDVLVVAHGGANRVILLNAIGAPLSALFNIEQNYCCYNIIDYFCDGNSVVKLLNG